MLLWTTVALLLRWKKRVKMLPFTSTRMFWKSRSKTLAKVKTDPTTSTSAAKNSPKTWLQAQYPLNTQLTTPRLSCTRLTRRSCQCFSTTHRMGKELVNWLSSLQSVSKTILIVASQALAPKRIFMSPPLWTILKRSWIWGRWVGSQGISFVWRFSPSRLRATL